MKSKHYGLTAVMALFVVLGSACTTTDENGQALARKRECRTQESLGSNIRQSICLTKEQWAIVDAREAENKQAGEDLKDEFLRRTLEIGSQSQGQGFDKP